MTAPRGWVIVVVVVGACREVGPYVVISNAATISVDDKGVSCNTRADAMCPVGADRFRA